MAARRKAVPNTHEELERRLLNALKKHPVGLTRAEINKTVFGNNVALKPVIDRLVAAGRITVEKTTRQRVINYRVMVVRLVAEAEAEDKH